MATAYNTEVRVYKNVPLIKGGVEVLFTHGNAQGVTALNGFLYKTYTEYYYQREVRNAIQIDDTITNIEGVNYIAWRNQSHGGVWYYAFVDSLAYINDNNTQINYTIDPFPTYLHECRLRDYVYVKRNSPKAADKSSTTLNYRPDYLPESAKIGYGYLAATAYANIACEYFVFFFTATETVIVDLITRYPTWEVGKVWNTQGDRVGIYYAELNEDQVTDVKEAGGEIIGAYAVPGIFKGRDDAGFYYGMKVFKDIAYRVPSIAQSLNFMSYFPNSGSSVIMNLRNGKIKTGVYHKIVLQTAYASKNYNVEDFANVTDINFGVVAAVVPEPTITIYPKNYQGFEHNVAAGVIVKCPSLPMMSKQVYAASEVTSDYMRLITSTATGAIGGLAFGSVGALVGTGAGLVNGLAAVASKAVTKDLQPPTIHSLGDTSCITFDGSGNPIIPVKLTIAAPSEIDYAAIDNYLDYYGWSWEEVKAKNDINATNGAYLQTGSEYCSGSEADVDINTRLMQGIKIITSFT